MPLSALLTGEVQGPGPMVLVVTCDVTTVTTALYVYYLLSGRGKCSLIGPLCSAVLKWVGIRRRWICRVVCVDSNRALAFAWTSPGDLTAI